MKRNIIISGLYINLIFNICNNINITPKNNELIYKANDPLFREKYGYINDYFADADDENNEIEVDNNEENNISTASIGTIGPFKPITPITLINPTPSPSTYNGDLICPYFNQKTFVKNYFENLYSNFPTNNVGNCGYTAISMLLQYYDTYWNSNFIDDKYNVNTCYIDSKSDVLFDSPGIKDIYYDLWTSENSYVDENDSNYKKYFAEATRKYIDKMYDSGCFMGYLYKIASDAGIIEYNTDEATIYVSYEVVSNELAEYIKLNPFINQYVHSTAKNLSNFNNNQTELRKAIIKKVKTGQPVIVGGKPVGGGGHVTVAYYYDENNDILYGHSGWKNNSFSIHNNSFCSLDSLFESYSDFYYIDVDEGLNHTHNKYFKLGTSNYCNCELDSHICSFYPISYGDKNYHTNQCLCSIEYELHSFVKVTSDTKQCKCKYMVSTPSQELN